MPLSPSNAQLPSLLPFSLLYTMETLPPIIATAAAAVYHMNFGPAGRAEYICSVVEESLKLSEQNLNDAKDLSPANPAELKLATDQMRMLFK